jgi:hypothetical protein
VILPCRRSGSALELRELAFRLQFGSHQEQFMMMHNLQQLITAEERQEVMVPRFGLEHTLMLLLLGWVLKLQKFQSSQSWKYLQWSDVGLSLTMVYHAVQFPAKDESGAPCTKIQK